MHKVVENYRKIDQKSQKNVENHWKLDVKLTETLEKWRNEENWSIVTKKMLKNVQKLA